MNWAASKGARASMEDYFKARDEAWRSASEFQKQIQLEKQRNQDELNRQVAMKQVEETMVKRMNPEQIESAASLTSSGDAIMDLYNQHQDAQNVPGFGKAVVGPLTNPLYNVTDPRVRLFNANREGSITQLAKGVIGDTGVAASKDAGISQMKEMMPNDQDNATMGGIKTINMLQKNLDQMGAKIRGLRGSNIDATPLTDAYSRTYNNYKNLVQSVGTKSQLEHPAASPDEVFGQQTQQYIAQGAAPIQPVVQGGVSGPSKATMDSVNAAAAGQPAQPQAAQTDPTVGRTPQLPSAQVWNPPVTYPRITDEPPTLGSSPAEQELVNAPGQLAQTLRSLLPKSGGPEEDLTQPPQIPLGRWGQ
jgi:hypothetical protein